MKDFFKGLMLITLSLLLFRQFPTLWECFITRTR